MIMIGTSLPSTTSWQTCYNDTGSSEADMLQCHRSSEADKLSVSLIDWIKRTFARIHWFAELGKLPDPRGVASEMSVCMLAFTTSICVAGRPDPGHGNLNWPAKVL